jgi:hypothetical protein
MPLAAAVALACALPVAAPRASAAGAASTVATFAAGTVCAAYVVPAGVYSVQIVATGGHGEPGYSSYTGHSGGSGGLGARVTATVPVTPGQTLTVTVAENGVKNSPVSGFPDGGTDVGFDFSPENELSYSSTAGGNAGGASFVATNPTARPCGNSHSASDYLVVAGGGGGGGMAADEGSGGNGGSAGRFLDGSGDTGRDGGGNAALCRGYSGGAGSPTGPGAGGHYTDICGTVGDDGQSGTADRGGNSVKDGGAGGAGGGGWFGGGSGGSSDSGYVQDDGGSGGGGAGSSLITPSATFAAYGSDTTDIPAVTITPATSAWQTLPALPAPRMCLAAATGADGTIYAIGGEWINGLAQSSVYAYTPGVDTAWRTMPSLPAPRMCLAAATGADGTLYAIGGEDNTMGGTPQVQASVYALKPGTDTAWRTAPSLPYPRVFLGAATDNNGTIYAMGGSGFYGGYPAANVSAYNPAYDTVWKSWGGLPARYAFAATTGADGTVYAIGGLGNPDSNNVSSNLSSVYAFNPSTISWSAIASLPVVTSALAAVTGAGGTLYAIGGNVNQPSGQTMVYAYTPGEDSVWRPSPPLPAGPQPLAWEAATAGKDGTLYVLGGEYGSSMQSSVYSYNSNATVTTGQSYTLFSTALQPVDIQGASTAPSTAVITAPQNNLTDQQWNVVDDGAGDGYVKLVNRLSGLCLDVYGAGTQAGSTIDEYTCVNQSNQLWQPGYIGGKLTLRAKGTGLYLSLPTSGSTLVIDGFDATRSEWSAVPTDDIATVGNAYTIIQAGKPLAVDDTGSSTTAGTAVIGWTLSDLANQQWTVVDDGQGDGWVKLVNKHSNLCLDVPGSGLQAGLKVDQYTCGNQYNQLWKLTYNATTRTYSIYGGEGLYLSLPVGGGQGSQLILDNPDPTRDQWGFEGPW